ncbi:MAG TPA: adenylate/guanylate cyclase domain-containing protein [Candidatus Limnocylindrales bacterium]|nr:adenylate/guanylate cyclase domain-containing protein [Candidatus Limnocylindrales bacterium]
MASATSDPAAERPSTPTFLFSDIEGSTRLIQHLGDEYATVLAEHRRLIGEAITSNGGNIFGTEGDALFCAFGSPVGAVSAAAAAQRRLSDHAWPADAEIKVRMGIHTGQALLIDGDYVGLSLHEVARITAAGHGGQVLVSEATRRLVTTLPAGLELRDLGERRLKDLSAPARIYQLSGEGLADRFPPLKTLDQRANNLPVQLTTFVGRAELAVAHSALGETRLLTLTGPGGTGKTRLALQLAAAASDDFADGVFFVGLDSVVDAALVPSEIATTIGLSISGSTAPMQAVVDYLRDKELLLVLDNFEQVVDAAATVGQLLREAPRIKIIVTTRIVLHTYGERELPVPPLGLPPPGEKRLNAAGAAEYEAVQLFVERALSVQPAFMLTDENAPLVVDITRRLDGLPLAIELAAARTRALSVPAIHARLDQHLALLTGGARDLPGRQQTLRGAIDWSYDLLEEPDKRLFERFSVHAGGAYLTQADAVCGPAAELGEDVLDGLTSLADKSLVKPDLAAEEDPRFAMLVTIRDYAHERLEGSEEFGELARRHAHTYLELAESSADGLTGREGRRLADRLENDHENLRAALDWAVANGEVEYALRFVVAVWRFWQIRGHLDEARRRVDVVISMPGVAELPVALVARAYGAAGGISYWQADVPTTHRFYTLALEAARRSGDERLLAEALYNFGFAAVEDIKLSNELYTAGRPYWEESLAIYERLGDKRGVADANWGLASAYTATGEADAGTRHAEAALAEYERLNDPFGIGWAHYMLSGFKVRAGDLVGARDHLRESLGVFAAAGDRTGILLNLAGYTLIAGIGPDRERANRLGGAVEMLRAATGAGLIDDAPEWFEFSIPVRPEGDPEASQWWDEGTRMSIEEAVAYALEDSPVSEQ